LNNIKRKNLTARREARKTEELEEGGLLGGLSRVGI